MTTSPEVDDVVAALIDLSGAPYSDISNFLPILRLLDAIASFDDDELPPFVTLRGILRLVHQARASDDFPPTAATLWDTVQLTVEDALAQA